MAAHAAPLSPAGSRARSASARRPRPTRGRADVGRRGSVEGGLGAAELAARRRARRHRDHALHRHRGLDEAERAHRGRALAGAAPRPPRDRPRGGTPARGLRGQVPGRRLHDCVPQRAPRGRVRPRDPGRDRLQLADHPDGPIRLRIGLTPARRSGRRPTSMARTSSWPRASPTRPAAARSSPPRREAADRERRRPPLRERARAGARRAQRPHTVYRVARHRKDRR